MTNTPSTSRDNHSVTQMLTHKLNLSNDPGIHDILVPIINATQTLINIAVRMDKLETKHTKSKNTKQKKI